MEKAHRVAVRWLHALRGHITCKNASKWIDIRERVEILVRNKDGSLLSLLPFELPVSLKKKWCKKVLHVLTNVDLQGCFPIVKKQAVKMPGLRGLLFEAPHCNLLEGIPEVFSKHVCVIL